MRYRIKITTFKNGRQEFLPQVKKLFGWKCLDYKGEECMESLCGTCDLRELALERIDKHYNGNCSVYKIEFEYITKNKK